jgi:hypothetical protein
MASPLRAVSLRFDRASDSVSLGTKKLCRVSAVKGVDIETGEATTLELRYQDLQGRIVSSTIWSASERSLEEWRSGLEECLGLRYESL